MPERAADRPMARAILSLLVAADQCCPAIIGQAHLLYHARRDMNPEIVEKTFAQLKREADDLCKAIADVESAMEKTREGVEHWHRRVTEGATRALAPQASARTPA